MLKIERNPDLVNDQPNTLVNNTKTDPNLLLKKGIWAYFILLIFEGALRKWFLPGLATPLLVVRDPIAIWLVLKSWQRGLLPSSPYLIGMILIGIISTFTAIFFGHGSIIVALFGARVLLFHFPLIFVIGKVFNRDDVIKIGKATLWITIPMAVLIALQFHSPQSAWVNRGVGGDMAGAGYAGANGFYRPPATFSFTTGTAAYFGFAACFIFYFWFDLKKVNKLILVGATLALLAAIPFSISRTLLFQTGLAVIFTVFAVGRKPKYFGKLLFVAAVTIVALAVLNQVSFLSSAIEATTDRTTSANKNEGGVKGTLGNRYLSGLTIAFTDYLDKPYFGVGIGMGTNVGSMLLAGGRTFLVAEDEWSRLVGELGVLLGMCVIFMRVGLATKLAVAAYKKLALDDFLPWLLLSYGLQVLLIGGWAQPTFLGFYVIIGGLISASLNTNNIKKELWYSKVNQNNFL